MIPRKAKQNSRDNYRAYAQSLIQNPGHSTKELRDQVGVRNLNVTEAEKWFRKEGIPTVVDAVLPTYRHYGYQGTTNSMRRGLFQRVEELVLKNPTARLPSKELAKEFGMTNVQVCIIARAIRKKLGAKSPPRGGPNFRQQESHAVRMIAQRHAGQTVSLSVLVKELEKENAIVNIKTVRKFAKEFGVTLKHDSIAYKRLTEPQQSKKRIRSTSPVSFKTNKR